MSESWFNPKRVAVKATSAPSSYNTYVPPGINPTCAVPAVKASPTTSKPVPTSILMLLNSNPSLVSSSFKYLFYLSLSPFRGVFPSIAMNTLATRDMVRSIRDSMELEKIVKINYYAKDYEYEISI